MSELTAEYTALSRAHDQLCSAADDVETERVSLTSSTEKLLNGDWTGPAASAWGAAFAEWSDAAKTVVDGLTGMGSLINQVRISLEQEDGNQAAAMNRLSARLGSGA